MYFSDDDAKALAARLAKQLPIHPVAPELAGLLKLKGPFSLAEEAEKLVKKKKVEPAQVAGIVVQSVESALADVGEHGRFSEFADDAGELKKLLSQWKKRVSKKGAPDALDLKLSAVEDLEGPFVAVMKEALKGTEKKVYESLWKTRSFGKELNHAASLARSPLMKESLAALISRECASLARGKDSWLARRKDVNALHTALGRLSEASFFAPRARVRLRAAAAVLNEEALVREIDFPPMIAG